MGGKEMDTVVTSSQPEEGRRLRIKKTGWSNDEKELLSQEVRMAREGNRPLRTVFERVAGVTNRRPNSVRNYYYATVTEAGEKLGKPASFVPFSEAEIKALINKVLEAQASGISVRACTMEMGNGDKKMMLRYQNKYRNVLKTDPERVRKAAADLREQGLAAPDPFNVRAGRRRTYPPGSVQEAHYDLVGVLSKLVKDAHTIEGMDAGAFFAGLGQLMSLAAAKGNGAQGDARQALVEAADRETALKARIEELKEEQDRLLSRILTQSSRNEKTREQVNALLAMLRQLMNVNRDFLTQNQVMKVSGLNRYIDELSRNVKECEKFITWE
jgi:hypothetical protein